MVVGAAFGSTQDGRIKNPVEAWARGKRDTSFAVGKIVQAQLYLYGERKESNEISG